MRFTDRRPLTSATVAGASAYVVGYLLTYGWLGRRVATMARDVTARVQFTQPETTVVSEPTLSALLGDGGLTATTWAGWLFYSAHFVPFNVNNPAVRFGSGSVPNLVLAADGTAVRLLVILPPLLLAAAGWLAVGERAGPTPGLLPAGARRGMTVAVGYLPMAVVGAFVFTVSPVPPWDGGAIGPGPLGATLLMGLAYPLAFGGLGGWLATRVGGDRSADDGLQSSTST